MYEKLTAKLFKENLNAGKYTCPAGARRAIGKAEGFSSADQETCRRAVDAYFKVDSQKQPTAKPTKVARPAPKVLAKETPKPKGRPVVATSPARPTVVDRSEDKMPAQRSIFSTPIVDTKGALDDFTNLTVQVKIAEKTIQSTGSALGSLLEAKKVCPEAELSAAINESGAVLAGAVSIFRGVTNKVSNYMNLDANRSDTKSQKKGNGKTVFEDTLP